MTQTRENQNRSALITGAGQGIGAAVARKIASQGARVIINDFYRERAEAVTAEINNTGGHAIAMPGDVTSYEEVERIVSESEERIGPISILVNNAGNAGVDPSGGIRAQFWEMDPAEWAPWLSVNLYGVLNCCRAVIPGMIEADSGGRIVTVISEAARVGEPDLAVYAAAKAGAAGLMRSLARALGRYEITANCVSIGLTRTPRVERFTEDEELLNKILRSYIIRRCGEPEDVAAMVGFLVSPEASWITGQTYPVNGGFSVNL